VKVGNHLNCLRWYGFRFEKKALGNFFLTNFKDNFKTLDLRRNTRRILKLPQSLKILREERKPISRAKYQNLMTLLKWIQKLAIF
jgi:hypothetical protein